MVQIIVGGRGTGKTKRLIDMAVDRGEKSKGHVVCIEKGKGLQFNLGTDIRLIDIEEYHIEGADAYYGFLSGLLAGNYDITDILCDATFKIICGEGKDVDLLEDFLLKVETLGRIHDCKIVFSVSIDKDSLPKSLQEFVV